MKRSIGMLALLVSFIAMSGCGSALPHRDAQVRIAQRNAFIAHGISATVQLHAVLPAVQDNLGSGIVIGKGRYVLTAYHVVEDALMVLASVRRAEFKSADQLVISYQTPVLLKMVRFSVRQDVALFTTEYGEPLDAASFDTISRRHPMVGDGLWHFGDTTGYSVGTVMPQTKSFLTLSAKSDEGDSGGPAVTPDGALAGVVVQDDVEKHLVYAVYIDQALAAVGL